MRGTDSQSEGTLLFPFFLNPHVHLRLSYLAPATIEVYYDKNYLTTKVSMEDTCRLRAVKRPQNSILEISSLSVKSYNISVFVQSSYGL